MKFQLTFKTPDVLDQLHEMPLGSSDAEHKQRIDVQELADKFIRYGESISVEFDTTTQTATVIKR